MALVKYGGGITDIRGAIGGQVHTKNRFGSIIRQNTKPVNPKTARQVVARAIMTVVVAAWNDTLSSAQRAAWETYANAIAWVNRLGETVELTGFNHFVRCNTAALQSNYSLQAAGPVVLSLPAEDNQFVITPSSASQNISCAFDDGGAWCSEDSAQMHVYQGNPVLQGRNFYGGPWKRLGSIKGDSGSPPTSPQTIAVDQPIAVDQRLFVAATIQRADRRLSKRFRDDAIIAS